MLAAPLAIVASHYIDKQTGAFHQGPNWEIGYAEIAAEFHMSADAVKMAASRLRKRYRVILRENIADTVASPEDVDDELRYLFAALSGEFRQKGCIYSRYPAAICP
jgi:hypothetical protein